MKQLFLKSCAISLAFASVTGFAFDTRKEYRDAKHSAREPCGDAIRAQCGEDDKACHVKVRQTGDACKAFRDVRAEHREDRQERQEKKLPTNTIQ